MSKKQPEDITFDDIFEMLLLVPHTGVIFEIDTKSEIKNFDAQDVFETASQIIEDLKKFPLGQEVLEKLHQVVLDKGQNIELIAGATKSQCDNREGDQAFIEISRNEAETRRLVAIDENSNFIIRNTDLKEVLLHEICHIAGNYVEASNSAPSLYFPQVFDEMNVSMLTNALLKEMGHDTSRRVENIYKIEDALVGIFEMLETGQKNNIYVQLDGEVKEVVDDIILNPKALKEEKQEAFNLICESSVQNFSQDIGEKIFKDNGYSKEEIDELMNPPTPQVEKLETAEALEQTQERVSSK